MKMYEQKKVKREWVCTGNESEDSNHIYKKLCNEMKSKYMEKAAWIRRIEQDYFYSVDCEKITVTYDNNYRTVYLLDR